MNIRQSIKEFFSELPVIAMFMRYEHESTFQKEALEDGFDTNFTVMCEEAHDPIQIFEKGLNLAAEEYTVFVPNSEEDYEPPSVR